MTIPSTTPPNHQRVLVIDDNRAIHEDFRKVLGGPDGIDAEMQQEEALLFGARQAGGFEIDSAYQGEEGLQRVKAAIEEGRPYSVAFVDFRMPPGWDGIQTTKHLWKVCPELQIVICTAYAECSWHEVLEEINAGDRLLILKKPFDAIEVLQLTNALTEKWRLAQESRSKMANLDQLVAERTADLETARVAAMGMMEEALRTRERERLVCEDLRHQMAHARKLEAKLMEKASLLDMAGDAILVCDAERRITYLNKSAEGLYGWTTIEKVGRPLSDLQQGPASVLDQAWQEAMRAGQWFGELPQTSKGGRQFVVDARWSLVRDAAGNPKGILAIYTDVAERKRLQSPSLHPERS